MNMEKAFIIHHYPYGESSVLLRLFSQTQGIVSAIAKGAKRPKSRWQGCLLPFSTLAIELSGGGDVKTVRQLEVISHWSSSFYESTVCGYYINELVLYLLPMHEPSELLFELYERTLTEINTEDAITREAALRNFEFDLLCELGLMPDLAYDYEGQPVEVSEYYHIAPESAPIRQSQASKPEKSFLGEHLLQIADKNWSNRAAAKKLMRQLIQFNLKGKTLKSRLLLKPTA